MDFDFTDEQKRFREEVQDFLKSELEQGSFDPRQNSMGRGFSQEFSRKMARKGWIGLTWPKEYGGQGRSYMDRLILMEEMLRAQAPIAFHFLTDRQVGPALIHFGSEELKREFLPRIIEAEISFCLCFSEPDAGSDLASVRTTAVEEGDYYLVNGQKLWTSMGHRADYGWLLAKTNPDSNLPDHKTLSEFILDMKAPGVTVQPLINIAEVHSFNEVFLDDVRIPKKYLVGKQDKGFDQIMEQVVYERAGIERLMQNYTVREHLLEYVKTTKKNGKYLWEDPTIRNVISTLETEFNIGRLLCYSVAWTIDQGKVPNYEASVCKVFCTQYEKRLSDIATQIMGLYGQLLPGSKWAPYDGVAAESYLWSPSYTLQGGTVEILKNIIALRGLKLQTK
ncbi:MAG: acyl-CoA dehydrogenase family protein [Thermodesulfobacteriota bacterium]|nr:acyl-CoA dehydrogenase family protein [Thermodesulfobacteriota bacterium]